MAATTSTVKLLDLLTNRFFGGQLSEQADGGWLVELAATAPVVPGQRLKMAAPGGLQFERRSNMRSVKVIDSTTNGKTRTVRLQFQPEMFAWPV